jgi:hypothetical protein
MRVTVYEVSLNNRTGINYARTIQGRPARSYTNAWDVDHACGGTRGVYDESAGGIVPTNETNGLIILSNNPVYTRFVAFSLEKYEFVCILPKITSSLVGPQWGMAPETSPWVNAAAIPVYYHSILDTLDKTTLDQIERAYAAHMEI